MLCWTDFILTGPDATVEQLQAKVANLEQTIIDINNTLGQFKGLMFGVIEELRVLRGGGDAPAFPRNASSSMQEGHRYATQAMQPSYAAPAPVPQRNQQTASLGESVSFSGGGKSDGVGKNSLVGLPSGLPSFDWDGAMTEEVDLDGALDSLEGGGAGAGMVSSQSSIQVLSASLSRHLSSSRYPHFSACACFTSHSKQQKRAANDAARLALGLGISTYNGPSSTALGGRECLQRGDSRWIGSSRSSAPVQRAVQSSGL
jgi:hypothetical protein